MNLHLRGEVAARIKLHDEVEVLLITERVIEPRDERVLAFWVRKVPQNVLLSESVVELIVREDGALGYSLHGVNARAGSVLDEQDLGWVSSITHGVSLVANSLAPHILYPARE